MYTSVINIKTEPETKRKAQEIAAEMGVSFAAWLARDPKAPLKDASSDERTERWCIELFWHRNFYPGFQMVANDLHAKGLIEAGKYTIDIDW